MGKARCARRIRFWDGVVSLLRKAIRFEKVEFATGICKEDRSGGVAATTFENRSEHGSERGNEVVA